ncbi:MerR family transcriptional regulator [Streptomyces decoyicus]|uniref:MerR family transcriptional regulator n=1 Tax=Streptomyces decoyicus TaxID=249567 RepID=UPI000B1E3159
MTNDSTSSARLAPPVGGCQEIEGRRVFVHRSGSGGPAVVFLPGASAVDRDASGHRRYSAQAAVDLIRIRTLADGGVPLARIDALLHAQPAEFAAAVTGIDAALQRKMAGPAPRRGRHQRRRAGTYRSAAVRTGPSGAWGWSRRQPSSSYAGRVRNSA